MNLDIIRTVTSRQRLKQLLATPLYANAIYLTLSILVRSLFTFIFWLVVARFYTEAEVGYSSAIISVVNYLALLSLIGWDSSLIRFMPQAEKPRRLINSCFTLCSLISILIAGIFIAGVDFWSPALTFIKENNIFVLVFIIFTLLWVLSLLIDATFIAKRRAGFTLIQSAISSILKIFLAVLLVLFFHAFSIVASWAIALGVAIAVSLFLFIPKVQHNFRLVPTLDVSLLHSRRHYAGGNYLTSLFISAPPLILPVIVVNVLGPERNAYFYVAWVMSSLLSAIAVAISSSLFAEGAHFEDRLGENVSKSLKFIFILLIPAVILLILVGKWLLLVFGQSYAVNGLKLFWILILSSLPLGINHVYTSILRVRGRLKELMAIWGFIAVTMLVTSYLIAPVTGIIGIGYTWLGTQSAVSIYITTLRRQLIRGSY